MDKDAEIVMGMAVIPPRLPNLAESLPGLLRQCDRLHMHINGPCAVPDYIRDEPKIRLTHTQENLGGLVKFTAARATRGYFLAVDDDIVYPDDYAAVMIHALRQAGGPAVACAHGEIFHPYLPLARYYHHRIFFNFEEPLVATRPVLIPGSGTTAYDTRRFVMVPDDFKVPHMEDIWVARRAADEGVRVLCVGRPAGWMRQLPVRATPLHYRLPMEAMLAALAPALPRFRAVYDAMTFPGADSMDEAARVQRSLPLVSVIIPTYNRPGGLARALQSLAAQDYPHLEAVVVNDGGADVAPALAAFQGKIALRYVRHAANQGPAAARNTGAQAATGVYLAYLEDDDVFLPPHLALLVTLAQAFPDCAGWYSRVFTPVWRRTPKGFQLEGQPACAGAPFAAGGQPGPGDVPLISLLHRRADFARAGGFDTTLATCEDWDFVLRLARLGPLRHFSRPTAEHVLRPEDPRQRGLQAEAVARDLDVVMARHGGLGEAP